MTTIQLASLLFSGTADSVSGFYFSDLTDWYTLSESKSQINERPQGLGAFGIGTDWGASLAVSFKGFFNGATPEHAAAARELLTSVRSSGQKVVMRVDDGHRATSRLVSVRRITPDDNHDANHFGFSVDMIAADPLRYGTELVVVTGAPMSGGGLLFPLGTTPSVYWDFGADGVSGRVSASNEGTASVWPTLSASGGLGSGFVATDVATGQTVRFERPIPEGSTVSINQRTGRASIDGQSDVSGFITARNFFSIPAGETHQIQFAPLGSTSGTPQFTVLWAPAYQ